MSFVSLLNTTITIQRGTKVSDGQGGYSINWEDLYVDIPARLVPASGREDEYRGAEKTPTTHTIYISGNYQLTEGDRVVKGDRVFDILFVRNPSEMNHHLELEAKEIKGGD